MSKVESSNSEKPVAPKRKRHWIRASFLVVFIVALSYLGFRLYNFLREADMSLGLTRAPGTGLEGMLVNQQIWNPPPDSLLRPSQIHFALRIATAIDTLDAQGVSKYTWRLTIADIVNEHMATRSAYTWIRNQIYDALTTTPSSHKDSADLEHLQMYLHRFRTVERVYQDSLDRELLVP